MFFKLQLRDFSIWRQDIFLTFSYTLREKWPYSELFWCAFFRIRTEYGEITRISPHSIRMRENADQNNSEYGHFLHSYGLVAHFLIKIYLIKKRV